MSARRHIAIHEAGHVVVGWREGVAPKRATIIPDPRAGDLGAVHHRAPRNPKRLESDHRYARRLLEPYIVSMLAGPAAERRARGRWNHQAATSDRQNASDNASRAVEAYAELDTYLAWLAKRANLAVARDWTIIEAVADALEASGTLQADELARVVRRAAILQRVG